MKKYALLVCMILLSNIVLPQYIVCNNMKEVDSAISNIIKKEFYKDPTIDSISLCFVLKLDTAGEIHSCRVFTNLNAHVTTPFNIKEEYFDEICRQIEDNIRILYLYNGHKPCLQLIGNKYCRWWYPYIRPRRILLENE